MRTVTALAWLLVPVGAIWLAAEGGLWPPLVPALVTLASLVTLGLYALDKSAAVQGRQRVRESTLHLWSLAGGWPGALAGRALLRHKTRKQPFRSFFLATLALNLALLAALAVPPGNAFAWQADDAVREWLHSVLQTVAKAGPERCGSGFSRECMTRNQ